MTIKKSKPKHVSWTILYGVGLGGRNLINVIDAVKNREASCEEAYELLQDPSRRASSGADGATLSDMHKAVRTTIWRLRCCG